MKNYNYGGIAQKDIQFDSVVIDDVEYIVPSTVANALKNYSERLAKECRDHAEAKANKTKKNEVIAEWIMSALEESANRESLLKQNINDFIVDPSTREHVYVFRNELLRRLLLALEGLNPEGVPFNNNGVIYYEL